MREPVTLFSYPTHIAAPHARTTLPQQRAEIESMVDQFLKGGGQIEQVPYGKLTGVDPMHMTFKQRCQQEGTLAKKGRAK